MAGPAGANTDTTPPTANPMATSPANENGWYREGPGIQWNWTDEESGVSPECQQFNETEGEGAVVYIRECADNAGNVGLAEFSVKIDSIPPTVTIDPDTNGGTLLRFSGTDPVSGIDRFVCALSDELIQHCESPIDLSGLPVGTTEVVIQAVDLASNVSESASYNHVVFPDLPSGSITVDGTRIVKKRNGDVSITGTQGEDAIFIQAGVEPGHVGRPERRRNRRSGLVRSGTQSQRCHQEWC